MLLFQFIAEASAFVVLSIVGIVYNLQLLIGPVGIILLTLAAFGFYRIGQEQ